MAPIAAMICFIFACFKFEPFDTVKMIPLGLFFVALALIIGHWPLGYINIGRSRS